MHTWYLSWTLLLDDPAEPSHVPIQGKGDMYMYMYVHTQVQDGYIHAY